MDTFDASANLAAYCRSPEQDNGRLGDAELIGRKRRFSRIDDLMKKYLEKEDDSPLHCAAVSPTNPAEEKTCRPWNRGDFFCRLHSFENVYDWFAKPSHLSPVAAALRGWRCSGRDRLFCSVCRAEVLDDTSSLQLSATAGGSFLPAAHREGCPWRDNQCDESFRNIPQFDFDAVALSRWVQATKSLFNALSGTDAAHVVLTSDDSTGSVCVDCCSLSDVAWLSSAAAEVDTVETPSVLRGAMAKLGIPTNAQQCAKVRRAVVAAMALSVTGWQGAAQSIGAGTNAGRIDLYCDFCRRRSPLVAGKAFDPLRQHRSYCAWINTQHPGGTVGWRFMCDQISLHLSAEDAASSAIGKAPFANPSGSLAVTAAPDVRTDPAEVFARVCRVLHSEL